MCVLSLSFVSDCVEHFSVFWCFTAQRIRSMMRIMMSGSLVRNSLSVSACKNVNSCLLHWGENTERPWKIKWFHFSTHRATLQRVHERLSDLMPPYQCYLTDAAANICFSRVGQLEEDGRCQTAERRCATWWSSASHDTSALWPVNRRVAAGAFTQSVHIHFVSPSTHKPTHTSWVCSSLEVLTSYRWAAVKSVSNSVHTIIFEPIPVFIY